MHILLTLVLYIVQLCQLLLFFYILHTVDDLTCKIWDVEKGKAKTNLRLSSYGVSATWNPNNPMQVYHSNPTVISYTLTMCVKMCSKICQT